MNPTDIYINKRVFAVDGFVDDGTVKTKDKSQGCLPSIMIRDPKLDIPIKIVYMKILE